MIRNDRQLAQTRHKAEAARSAATAAEAPVDRASWTEVAEELEDEMTEYEAVRSGARYVFELSSIDDLAEALVKARLAKGWTQKQLALELGVSEQMVQRDEVVGYQKASLARLADVADALGFQLQGRLQLVGADLSPPLLGGMRMWSDNDPDNALGSFTAGVHTGELVRVSEAFRAVVAQTIERLLPANPPQGVASVPDERQSLNET